MARDIYLALGDSITAGHGATHPASGFVYLLGRRLRSAGSANRLAMVAKGGWTTRNLLSAVHRIPESVWKDTAVVSLCIGGNDLRQLLRGHMFTTLKANSISKEQVRTAIVDVSYRLNELCNLIHARAIPNVSLASLYNPAPHSSFVESAIQDINQVISACAKRYGFQLTDLHAVFHGRQSSTIAGFRHGKMEDLVVPFRRPIHPNDDGHSRICDAFAAVLIRKVPATSKGNVVGLRSRPTGKTKNNHARQKSPSRAKP